MIGKTKKTMEIFFQMVYNRDNVKIKEDNIMAVLVLNKDNFENEVLNSDKPVLVDFYADWCGPCRMTAPVIEEISDERSDIKVCKVNVSEQPELAEKYEVDSIPALAVFKNGRLANFAVGARPKEQILALL